MKFWSSSTQLKHLGKIHTKTLTSGELVCRGIKHMNSWILLVHLGPVQDLIASARRCRDLWYGSQLLSALAHQAATALLQATGLPEDERENAIIFPGSLADNQERSVANKIQLLLCNKEEAEVRAIAEAGREAMQKHLAQLGENVLTKIEERANAAGLHRQTAEKQLELLMEYMWVAVPLPNQESYKQKRQLAEEYLAARKNTRDWPAYPPGRAGVPKSSLDGERDSVIDESVYGPTRSDAWRRHVYGISSTERLCGIGLLKRLGAEPSQPAPARGDDTPPFHSSGHIAAAGVRARLHQCLTHSKPQVRQRTSEAYKQYLEQLAEANVCLHEFRVRASNIGQGKHWHWQQSADTSLRLPRVMPSLDATEQPEPNSAGLDGVLLYPSRLGTIYKEYNNYEGVEAPRLTEQERNNQLKQLERSLNCLLKTLKLPEPCPYYALILADGDKMGQALDSLESSEQHKKFSLQLEEEFAQKCGALVEQHGGSLIYSGGDDVLAIVPLVSSLRCARALRDQFNQAMSTMAEHLHNQNPPTLSVGVAIAHYLEPFAQVRNLAKQAESSAKKDAGRNALAILLKKRGGAPKLIYEQWKDSDLALDQRIERWADLQTSLNLPRGFAHQLEEITHTLEVAQRGAPIPAQGTQEEVDLVHALVKRVIQRRDISANQMEQFEALFQSILQEKHNQPYTAVRALSAEFQIAAEFRKSREEFLLPDFSNEFATEEAAQ